MSTLLIKNGTLVTHSTTQKADILVSGEKIKKIADKIANLPNTKTDEIIDASGLLVFPGFIDAHTHMELPLLTTTSSDDFTTGSIAALAGGTTTIIDFANQKKGDSLENTLKLWLNKAENKTFCDYAFHVSITELTETTFSEVKNLKNKYGVNSFKTFMAYDNMMLTDVQLQSIMEMVKKIGGIVTVHAEDGKTISSLIKNNLSKKNTAPRYHPLSRPACVEEDAIIRLITLVEKTMCPTYIVHLSSGDGLRQIMAAKKRGLPIYAETCPQYLTLDDSEYFEHDFYEAAKYVLSPPLRKDQDQIALWKGLKDGIIDVLATDHCPFNMTQKELGIDDFSKIPNGLPGVENRIEVSYSEGVLKNKISLQKFVEINALNPAKIFGLYPKKGTLDIGSDADIVLFDPTKKHTLTAKNLKTRCDYSPYEGLEVTGKVITTILRGNVMIHNLKFIGTIKGNYTKRSFYK